MFERITRFMREYVLTLSIVTLVIGLFLLITGALWVFLKIDALQFIHDVREWNDYVLIIGLIIVAFGLWYLYSYLTKRKFVLTELKTNKRSEFLKKHRELKDTVKRLPSKYKTMLEEKEETLHIR